MGYGADADRAPAIGGGALTDVDIFKVGLLANCERGLADLQEEIYDDKQFYKQCGKFNVNKYGAYVMKSFFDTLNPKVQCELKVKMYVASDAVQAGYVILDTAGSPIKIFDITAGRKNKVDKSAFGNKIAIKTTRTENTTFKLTEDTSATPTTAVFDQVEGLKVGHYIRFDDGSADETEVITAINTTTKTVTFSALTATFTAALTTVYRQDWNLFVAVENAKGVYIQEEKWEDYPMAKSDILGMPLAVNDETVGSDYVILAVDDTNSTGAEDQRPAEIDTWTPMTSGADGTGADDANWLTDVSYFDDSEIFILMAPESSSTDHINNMATYATSGYKWIYYAQSSNGAVEATLKNVGAIVRSTVKFGMLPVDKWFETNNPIIDGGKIDIPPTGYAVAHWYNSFALNGAQKVAAGNTDTLSTSDKLLDGNGLTHDDTLGVGGRLIRHYSVNIAKFRKGKGITINSARTFSTDDGYKFQNQIMLWLIIKRSIVEFLKTIEQDSAGGNAQESHYKSVWSYMKKKYDEGAFYVGHKEDGTPTTFADVVIIINDFSINTLANINSGIEEMFLQFIAAPPIEEPKLGLASAGVTSVQAG